MTRFCIAVEAMLLAIAPARALDGQPAMRDPSTVIESGGRFYVYATGNGLPAFLSEDRWTWRCTGLVMQAVSGGKPGPEVIARGNVTWAPDTIRAGGKHFLYYARRERSRRERGLLVGRTLDRASPDYKWEDAGPWWSSAVIHDPLTQVFRVTPG
jgi:arabinan endo-1,5-alpha-L-arabinosidase